VSGIDVTRDQILDGMVTALATVTAGVGVPVSATRYLYSAQRYMGGEFTTQEAQERGLAGRTPAVRVSFVETRTIRTTIGRRRDLVEDTYGVYAGTDIQRGRDSRKSLLAAMDGVNNLLGSRALSLGVKPLRRVDSRPYIDNDKLLVYLDKYTTRYRVDYTKDPGNDVIEDAHGSIVNAKVAHTSIPTAPTLTRIGAAGATTWAYAVVGIDAAGLRTLISPTASIANGAAVLNGTDKVQVSWLAYPGIATYELHRMTAGGTPNTLGLIGTTALLTLTDTGLASLGATPPDSVHVDVELVYP
jgi:hypothetical protein